MAETPTTQTWPADSVVQQQPMDPVLMTGALVQILRYCFADAKNIRLPALKPYLWVDDVTTSPIVIEPVWKFSAENLNQRPALFVSRGACRPPPTAIGQERVQGDVDGTAQDFHGALMVGSMSIIVIAHDPMEQEQLAVEASNFVMEFGPRLRADFNLMRFRLAAIDVPQKIEECANHMGVRVLVDYGHWRVWRLRSERPYLKVIDVQSTN